VALALQLKALGQEVHFCVPPDFRGWIEGLGMAVTAIGPDLRSTAQQGTSTANPTPEQVRQMMAQTVADQFETISAAAEGCDVIVAATALQVAARSVAEKLGVPCVFVAYCPVVVPSPHHAPPVLTMLGDTPEAAYADHQELWARDGARWDLMWGDLLNARRAELGLRPVAGVLRHILTDRPWLATDPILAPWPGSDAGDVVQTGDWTTRDERPLAPELETYLAAGEPPVYLGFGSNRAPEGLAEAVVGAARRLGKRLIVSRGWADLQPADEGPDLAVIGEVNQQRLFRRVAAVVHHGGAGTTTAAAKAAAPQLVIPQHYDQFYWAERVSALGIGSRHLLRAVSEESLAEALEQALGPEVGARARSLAERMHDDGASLAAKRLVAEVGGGSA
jgi:vancomycin aglycone glucosyltransferase